MNPIIAVEPWQRVRSAGPFHAINLDLCGGFAGREKAEGIPNYFAALQALLQNQTSSDQDFLLFITTRMDDDSIDTEVKASLNEVAQSIHDTCEAYASEFASAWGLPADGQVTSARDLALLARTMLLEFPEYRGYWGIGAVRLGNKVMKNHHGGVVLIDGHLYGHSDPGGWACQDLQTGKEVWSTKEFGKGAVHFADGMLYCLSEGDGEVALVEASTKGWNLKSRFKLDPQSTQRSRDGRRHAVCRHTERPSSGCSDVSDDTIPYGGDPLARSILCTTHCECPRRTRW